MAPQDPQHHRCSHDGYHSPTSNYIPSRRALRFYMVCDDCGEEVCEVEQMHYAPRYLRLRDVEIRRVA